MTGRDYTVVVPTTGRAGLAGLLSAVDGCAGPRPAEIIVVDDRRGGPPLSVPARVVRTGGRGPAAARNAGWRLARTEWVAFLDDDVVVSATWAADLDADLDSGPQVAGSQARIAVPVGRRPTDDARGTAGLETARWITADMAYRRRVLAEVGGFDERFPRAYREDSDLALRVLAAGHELRVGDRRTTHPPAAGGFLASVRRQAGNADDALMRRKHGPHWRARSHAGRGMLARHTLTTASATAAGLLAVTRRPRPAAVCAAATWAALTASFAWRRVRPGPRTPAEVTRMLVTSVLIPPVAVAHRLSGEWRVRRRGAEPGRRPGAVLFDRDDTLIADVPYLGDPERVRPVPGAAAALDRLRAAGIPVGVVSNQSGVARGLISRKQLSVVNDRVEALLGPFGTWQVCVHGDGDGCACRKPAPGLVRRAAAALGADPSRCVLIGDTGADVEAAVTAGATGVLVPTARTLPEEVRRSELVAATITDAVALAVGLITGREAPEEEST